LVIDNGAHTLKAGFVTADAIDEPTVVPNCIARDRTRKTYVASDLSKCKDFGEISFRRPVDKGYIVNWEAQKEIWDHEFFSNDAPLKCDPAETRLVLTEQPNSVPALQTNCDQMVFEEFGFASYYRGIGESPQPPHPSTLPRERPSLLITCQRRHSMHTTMSKPSSEPPNATRTPWPSYPPS
jgi:actin-related protein 6